MTSYALVTKEKHLHKRWQSAQRYDFAKSMAVVPIAAEEIPRASRQMVCAFTQSEGRFVLSVVMGLKPETNLFVAENGRWLGGYIPALLRAYPFALARLQGQDELALVIDEAGGLASDGEPFFDDEGRPAMKLAEFIDFLSKITAGRRKTDLVVKELEEAGLIEEWQLTLKGEDGQEQKMSGLFRVAEEKLNLIDDATFLKLRRSQALPLAYMQLFSMHNIHLMGRIAQAKGAIAQKQAQEMSEFFYGDQDDELKIDWSQFEAKE